MKADADPSFEVATIKPSRPDGQGADDGQMGHRVVMRGTTMLFLVGFAYDLHEKQIAGAPTWMASEKFDLNGVADTPGAPNLAQLKSMIRKLLVERMQMHVHRETRELSAYVLTVANDGPKMTVSGDDARGLPSLMMQPGFPKVGVMKARNVTMTNFAQLMQSGVLDRPVVDRTGLTPRYDFLLKWTPDESQFTQVGARMPAPAESADAPSLFTAMTEELGLKLTADKKAAVAVLVVDRVMRPSAN